MKRFLALCLAAGLCLLAGCSTTGTGSSGGSASGEVSSSEPSSSEPASSELGSGEPATSEPSSGEPGSSEPLDTSAVTEMMDALTAYQPGTAGSSLKVYIAACGILNYAEGYDTADEETLRQGVTAWMNAAAPDTLEMVRETFYAVTGAAEGVLAGDAESLALLADAGSPNRYDSYDPDRYETVKNILTELLQPQASDEGGAE